MIGQLQVPHWTWWIILYFFAGGIAGGAYILATIIELVGGPEDRPAARMGYYIAFPLSIVCAVLLIVDLGRPERFWHMVLYSPTFLPWVKWNSPISVGAFALLFFGAFSFVSFVDALIERGSLRVLAPVREAYAGSPRKVYALAGSFFGFFLAAYTGELLATTELPLWQGNAVLGALFLASGASTGLAAILLGLMLTKARLDDVAPKIRQADVVAIIVEAVLVVLFLVLAGAAAGPLLTGLGAVLLFGGVVVVGLLAPLALQWRGEAANSAALLVATPVLILVGGFVLRAAIVLAGQGLL